ncbi:hypothetical protein D3C81_1450740 [compost metagenome]
MIAIANGLAGDRGHVGAGIGLGPALGPHVDTGRHARQEALLLRLGTELHQRWAEQQLTVLVDTHRCVCAVVLFLENQPLDQVATAPAVSLGPHDHRQALLEQLRLPGPVLLEPFPGVIVGQGRSRLIGRQPFTHFLTEGLLLGGIS